jgi:ELP3 family radical SAM enzyme/protein acetyltransferase
MSLDPDDYKHCKSKLDEDIEEYNNDIDENLIIYYHQLIKFILEKNPDNDKDFDRCLREFNKLNKQDIKAKQLDKRKCVLMNAYNILVERKIIESNNKLKDLFIKKRGKSLSGVLVITVLTSPNPNGQQFSCAWNCYFCPNEPGQPRSYLHDEPAVLRSNKNNFIPLEQIYDRLKVLEINGHPLDKIELLILGGTWTSYPILYREQFIKECYYACNTFNNRFNKYIIKSLEEEKLINETADIKIIGITIELRPDCINKDILYELRKYGITRIQMGIQHTNNKILKKINRGCYNEDTKRAIKLLKDSCYKLDIHIMPNLPGATPEIDKEMFNELLFNPDLQADQWKIYPCEIVPWTIIKKWYEDGLFIPYPECELVELLITTLPLVHPWIRINRIKRDIPSQYVLTNSTIGNLRNDIDEELKKRKLVCNDIRFREVKNKKDLTKNAILVVKTYESSGGIEYFISFETVDHTTIFGFLRLRLTKDAGGLDYNLSNIDAIGNKINNKINNELSKQPEIVFPELNNCALIRELHVYGKLEKVIKNSNNIFNEQQHVGFGKQMMKHAEKIAITNGYTKIAVISGNGVRNYYRKLGYELDKGNGEFMIKNLKNYKNYLYKIIYLLIIILLIKIFYYFSIF